MMSFSYRGLKINDIEILPTPKKQEEGTCARHAAVVCTQSLYKIKHAKKQPPEQFPSLSIQHCIDATSNKKFTNDVIEWLRDKGVTTEDLYPYEGPIGTYRCSKNWIRYHIRGCYDFNKSRAEEMYDELCKQLMEKGPFMGCFVILSDYFTPNVESHGHYKAEGELRLDRENQIPKHLVTITGFGEKNGERVWEYLNSFGPNWGRDGYGTLPFRCVDEYFIPYLTE
ncbi:uncharacterized protein [Euphorbia lathyris]|uniref:uncharacterized protein n=1 Tax=Euphorbia lathyris TaxID=212925 RepID=UPI0033137336